MLVDARAGRTPGGDYPSLLYIPYFTHAVGMCVPVRFCAWFLSSFFIPFDGSRLQWEVRILRACFASFQVHFGLLGPRFKMSKA